MGKGITPVRLAAIYLLGGLAAAALGTTPIAGWLDSSDNDRLRDLAPQVQAFGARTGLDQPYRLLRQVVRGAEVSKFIGSY